MAVAVFAQGGVMARSEQRDCLQESQADWLVRGVKYRFSGCPGRTRPETLLVEVRVQGVLQLEYPCQFWEALEDRAVFTFSIRIVVAIIPPRD